MKIDLPSLKTMGIVLIASILGALYVPAWHAWQDYQKDREYRRDEKEFSRWLTAANDEEDTFGDFLSPLKSKGLYVCAVEGRWNQDHIEYRVRLAKRPKDAELHRFWWFGIDEASYMAHLHELTEQNTFKCVSSQHFTDGMGVERYQVVFLKFLPLNSKPAPIAFTASSPSSEKAGWDPKVAQILNDFAKFYAGVHSFQTQIKSTLHLEGPNDKSEHQATLLMAISRPNSLALLRQSNEGGGFLISDGKTVTAYQAVLKRYTSSPAPPQLAPIINPMDLAMTMEGDTFAIPLLLADDPGHVVRKESRASIYVGEEQIGGIPAHHLRFSGKESVVIDLWIATGNAPLLLQTIHAQEVKLPNSGLTTIITTDVFSDWQIDKPVPSETFTLNLPKEAIKVPDFAYGFSIPEAPSPFLGQPAPDFTLNDLDGHPVSLASLKGKVVVLDFWATWCPPCCKALPLVSRTALSLQDKGVAFYAVDVREKADPIHSFLAENGLSIPVLLDAEGKASHLYQAKTIPQTFVIDRNGIVQAVHSGYHGDIDTKLKSELDTLLDGKSLIQAKVTQVPPPVATP